MSNKLAEKKESDMFIVALKYNETSANFFIDFSNEKGYIVSIKISESVAFALREVLLLKIMVG